VVGGQVGGWMRFTLPTWTVPTEAANVLGDQVLSALPLRCGASATSRLVALERAPAVVAAVIRRSSRDVPGPAAAAEDKERAHFVGLVFLVWPGSGCGALMIAAGQTLTTGAGLDGRYGLLAIVHLLESNQSTKERGVRPDKRMVERKLLALLDQGSDCAGAECLDGDRHLGFAQRQRPLRA
jgi:hypothetical protein